jgi:hypothetical protein
MKSNNKFTRFTLRSLEKVDIEFGLMALAHNLRKWAKRKITEEILPQDPTRQTQNRKTQLHIFKNQQCFALAA